MDEVERMMKLSRGHSYIIQQEQMGCGALCGEEVEPKSISLAHQALAQLVGQLRPSPNILPQDTLSSFMQKYQEKPHRYALPTPTQLTKGEPVPYHIMTKWKCILYGTHTDDKLYQKCLGLTQYDPGQSTANEDPSLILRGESTLLFHESFPQIEKDLERTFSLPEGRKGQFENVLKRIANHFPKMGYTQGINFIIGYLIIIGYSEEDSFWMFVHIAINKRYLLLGLYEDGFPLSNACTSLFTNIIRRKHPQLYNHLFEDLMVDPSMWVFKWFMTCFLYSFPFEMIQHVWDLLIQVGNLGLVAFAVSLTLELASSLLSYNDLADISIYLAELKQLEAFNSHINLKKVIKKAYDMDFAPSDFAKIEKLAPFYGEVIKKTSYHKDKLVMSIKELPKSQKEDSQLYNMLNEWHQTLTDERIKFKTNKESTLKQANIPLQIESFPKIMHKSSNEEINGVVLHILEPKNPQTNYPENEHFDFDEDPSPSILSPPMPEHAQESAGKCAKMGSTSTSTRQIPKQNDLIIEQIYQGNESQQQSVHSVLSKSSNIKIDPLKELDELDRFSMEFDKPKRNSMGTKNNPYRPKVPSKYFKRNTTDKRHMPPSLRPVLLAAGQNMFKEDSYDAVSVSSKHSQLSKNTNPPPRSPQGSLMVPADRMTSSKTKTQEDKVENILEPLSQHAQSSKDKLSETHSIAYIGSMKGGEPKDSLHNLMEDGHNMISSHGPKLAQFGGGKTRFQQIGGTSKGDSEMEQVQVLPFKKSKMGKDSRITHIDISKKASRQIGMECQSKSIESIYPEPRQREYHRYNVEVESTS